MGSFNMKCFASNQIISTEDSCLVYPLKQQSGYSPVQGTFSDRSEKIETRACWNSICYPNSMWEPINLPIEAVYADYGRYDPVESKYNQFALRHLARYLLDNALKIESGENTSHEKAVDFQAYLTSLGLATLRLDADKGFSFARFDVSMGSWTQWIEFWNYYQEANRQNRVFVKNHWGVFVPTSLGAAHGLAVAAAGELYANYTDWNNLKFSCPSIFESVLKDLTKIKELENKLESGKFTEDQRSDLFFELYNIKDSGALSNLVNYSNASFSFKRFTDSLIRGFVKMKTSEFEDLSSPAMTNLKEFVEHLSRMKLLDTALGAMNLTYGPSVYASQDYDNSAGSSYSKFVSKVEKKIKVVLKKRYDE